MALVEVNDTATSGEDVPLNPDAEIPMLCMVEICSVAELFVSSRFAEPLDEGELELEPPTTGETGEAVGASLSIIGAMSDCVESVD